VPVVWPGFNFPTGNSVADDFSLGHRRQLDRAELRSQQRTDHLYHRHGIVASRTILSSKHQTLRGRFEPSAFGMFGQGGP
jgi:hypothetical protein